MADQDRQQNKSATPHPTAHADWEQWGGGECGCDDGERGPIAAAMHLILNSLRKRKRAEGRDKMCTGPRPFIPVTGVAKVELRYIQDSQQLLNVLYFLKVGDWTPTTLQALGDLVETAWLDNVQITVSDSVELQEVYVRSMSSEVAAEATTVVNANGTAASPALPNNVTIALSFRTGSTGRSKRGRMYIVGLTEGHVTGNELTPLAEAELLTAWPAFFDQIQDDVTLNVEHVVVSFCEDGNWRIGGLATGVNTMIITDRVVDSMRRRLPGRGR